MLTPPFLEQRVFFMAPPYSHLPSKACVWEKHRRNLKNPFSYILLFTPAIWRLLNCLSRYLCAKILSQSLNNLKMRLVEWKVFAKEWEPWLQVYLAGFLYLREELKKEWSWDMAWYTHLSDCISFMASLNQFCFNAEDRRTFSLSRLNEMMS